MKVSSLVTFSVCFILLLGVASMSASIQVRSQDPSITQQQAKAGHKLLTFTMKKISDQAEPQQNKIVKDGYLCPTCIDILDFGLADLTAAADSGVFFSCYKLCSAVSKWGAYAFEGCNVMCDIVGVNFFIDIIKKADLDPIYGCQLANICPVRDCTARTCATFSMAGFVPSSVKVGAPVAFYSTLNVLNSTGPGEAVMTITGPFTTQSLIFRAYQAAGYTPGTYSVKFNVPTKDDNAISLEWMTGTYNAVVDVCEGECGSDKPHSRLLAETKAQFTLTSPMPSKN